MYKYNVNVEFEDVDSYGIAHHTKLISYLERARVHFFTDKKFDVRSTPYGLILVDINIQFKIPLLLMDSAEVQLKVKRIDRVRFQWDYKIIKDGKIAVQAEITQVVIEIQSKKLIPIPSDLREILETILITGN
jgi:YbgC/YbaW family acyl-CoA thioester hydrolase